MELLSRAVNNQKCMYLFKKVVASLIIFSMLMIDVAKAMDEERGTTHVVQRIPLPKPPSSDLENSDSDSSLRLSPPSDDRDSSPGSISSSPESQKAGSGIEDKSLAIIPFVKLSLVPPQSNIVSPSQPNPDETEGKSASLPTSTHSDPFLFTADSDEEFSPFAIGSLEQNRQSHIAGWQENNKALVVTKQVGTKQLLYSLDIGTKELTLMETPDLTRIRTPVLSLNRKYMGFSGENLHQAPAIYASNIDSFSPKKISSLHEKINLGALKAKSITWNSYDGLEIEGILTYPQGYKEGKKVPLLISIHGGPGGVESQQFMGSTSFGAFSPAVFASQGYASLVVNYRGSLGYGEEFQKIDYKDLGGGDYKDIMTGVDYLIEQGIADPDQLFIRGHSYGGFLSAWAIRHTNRFKAAIIDAGIVDWISDNATTDSPPSMEAYFGGAYWENYELWRRTSPIR